MISEEDLKEVLGELVNISFGYATASIADLFDNFATLHVPEVNIVGVQELDNIFTGYFDDGELYVTTQQFRGEFHGEVSLVIEPESAANMNKVVGGEEGGSENEIRQNLLEIANILGVTCLSQLADLLETETSFSPPSIQLKTRLIENIEDSPYDQAIIISTVLLFEDLDIKGNLFILCNDAAISWLLKVVEEYMENNM